MRIAPEFAQRQLRPLAQQFNYRRGLFFSYRHLPQVRLVVADRGLQPRHRVFTKVFTLFAQVIDEKLNLRRNQVLEHAPRRRQAGLQHQVCLDPVEGDLVFMVVLADDGKGVGLQRAHAHQDAQVDVIVVGAGDDTGGMIEAGGDQRFAVGLVVDDARGALDPFDLGIDDYRLDPVLHEMAIHPAAHSAIAADNPVAGRHRDRLAQFHARAVHQAGVEVVQPRRGNRHAQQLRENLERVDDSDVAQ